MCCAQASALRDWRWTKTACERNDQTESAVVFVRFRAFSFVRACWCMRRVVLMEKSDECSVLSACAAVVAVIAVSVVCLFDFFVRCFFFLLLCQHFASFACLRAAVCTVRGGSEQIGEKVQCASRIYLFDQRTRQLCCVDFSFFSRRLLFFLSLLCSLRISCCESVKCT